MAASPYNFNGVAFGAFMHDMNYIILLHAYYSLYILYRNTRKCHGPTKWPTIKGTYIGAFPAPCKDFISICTLRMITMMVSNRIKIFLIFAMLVTMPTPSIPANMEIRQFQKDTEKLFLRGTG